MRWVEVRAYVGPSRRRRETFRLFERRKADLSTSLPAAQVLMRQLHLRVLDLATAREALALFHLRLTVTSTALTEAGQLEAAAELAHVKDTLETSQRQGALSSAQIEDLHERTKAALRALR